MVEESFLVAKEQLEYNRTHGGFKMEFRNFITTDYPKSFFDKIYSIESFEHVRPHEMYPLAQKLFHTLKPGGTATHQISIRLPVPIPANAPVVQIFFPGTIATPYIHFLHDCERAGFRVTHQSIVDYRPTLRHWFDRLVANRERAIELATRLDNPLLLGRALVQTGTADVMDDRFEGLQRIRRGIELGRQRDLPALVAHGLSQIGSGCGEMRRYEEAVPALLEGSAFAASISILRTRGFPSAR